MSHHLSLAVHGSADFSALSRGLAARLGSSVEIVSAATYAALPFIMESCDALAALAPPMVALDLERWGTASTIAAVVRGGSTRYAAALAVRASGPETIDECAGSRVAWVSKLSAAGYVVPRLWMESVGLDAEAHFDEQRFTQSHAASMHALVAGEVDVAATYVVAGRVDRRLVRGSGDLRLLATIAPIPSEVVVVSPEMAPDLRHSLIAALTALDAESLRPLLRAFEIEGFAPADTHHLDPLRALVVRARASAPPMSLCPLSIPGQ